MGDDLASEPYDSGDDSDPGPYGSSDTSLSGAYGDDDDPELNPDCCREGSSTPVLYVPPGP